MRTSNRIIKWLGQLLASRNWGYGSPCGYPWVARGYRRRSAEPSRGDRA